VLSFEDPTKILKQSQPPRKPERITYPKPASLFPAETQEPKEIKEEDNEGDGEKAEGGDEGEAQATQDNEGVANKKDTEDKEKVTLQPDIKAFMHDD